MERFQIMRYTSAVVAAIGLGILLMSAIVAMLLPVSTPGNGNILGSQIAIPVVFGLGALVLAGILRLMGDRGYFVTNDPTIRN
jgi:hypothetical protein